MQDLFLESCPKYKFRRIYFEAQVYKHLQVPKILFFFVFQSNDTMKYLYFTLYFIVIPFLAQSQDLVTDRPDATESASVMSPGSLQIETGFILEKLNTANTETQLSGQSTLFRYGLFQGTEFRLVVDYLRESYLAINDEKLINKGLGAITIGTKFNLMEADENKPEIAFLGHLTIPNTGNQAFEVDELAPAFRFAIAKDINEQVGISSNIGIEWDGSNTSPIPIYSLALGLGLTDELGAFAEIFGEIPDDGGSSHHADFGLTYLFNPDMQADMAFGFGLNENSNDFLMTIGFSIRLFED